MECMTVNNRSFNVLKLLGKGKGGYSYLVCDTDAPDEKYVLKQIHHEPCSYYQFGDKLRSEINDYARLKKIGIKMPEMIDVDAENERILKEYIDGPTIAELAKSNSVSTKYFKQIYAMCRMLYSANINIDYFPTNFVVQKDEIYYIDYECNDYMEEWNFENWGIKYWSKTVETERLLLRRFFPADIDDLFEYVSDTEVVKFEPYAPMSREEAEKNLEWRISTDEMIAIELKDTHKVVGNVYLGKRDFNSLEIGYVLNKDYWHKGIAKEACVALIDDAFKSGVHRIYAECDPLNENSWGLLEALGFNREAHLMKNVYFHKDEIGKPIWKDTYIYSLLNAE